MSPANHTLKCCARLAAGALSIAALTIPPAVATEAGADLLDWSFDYHNTPVTVAIWYPADEPPVAIDAGPFTLQVAAGSEPSPHKHPLVVVSHGTGGSNIAHHPLAEALAQAGYLVAALTHPGDNYQDRSLVADERYFDERPRQIAALLNALAADEKLRTLIDDSRIGAIGHSAGGYAVAANIGARPDREGLMAHCQTATNDPSCHYKDPTIGVSSPSSNAFALPAEIKTVQPAWKIRSAALLAPLGSVIDAASRINEDVDVLLIGAEHDEILPHRYHLQRLTDVAPHAEVKSAAGAGHFSFIAPINAAWQSPLGEVAIDPPGFDRARYNRQLGRELVAWFDRTLRR